MESSVWRICILNGGRGVCPSECPCERGVGGMPHITAKHSAAAHCTLRLLAPGYGSCRDAERPARRIAAQPVRRACNRRPLLCIPPFLQRPFLQWPLGPEALWACHVSQRSYTPSILLCTHASYLSSCVCGQGGQGGGAASAGGLGDSLPLQLERLAGELGWGRSCQC